MTRKSYPYFRKQAAIEKNQHTKAVESADRYTLCSIAQLDSSLLETYLCYFGTFYNRKYHREGKSDPRKTESSEYCQENFSECYKVYLEVVVQKMMINLKDTMATFKEWVQKGLTRGAQKIENQLKKPEAERRLSPQMEATIKATMEEISYKSIKGSDIKDRRLKPHETERALQDVKEINNFIKMKISQLLERLEDDAVRREEVMPEEMETA